MGTLLTVGLKLLLLGLFTVDPSPSMDMYLNALKADERVQGIPVGVLLDAAAPAQGSTVLDLGAGAGLLLPELSKRVGPEGQVLASELDDGLLGEMRELKAKAGLKNVQLLKVGPLGLDPAYEAQRFDLVLLVGVYEFMIDPRGFFCRFKPLLKPGGRIVVVHPKLFPPLSEERYFDVDHFRGAVRRDGEQSPILPFLSPETRRALFELPTFEKTMYPMLVRDLNKLTADRRFTLAMLRRHASNSDLGVDRLVRDVNQDYKPLLRWALGRFGAALHKPEDTLSPYEREGIRVINWMILASQYISPEIVMVGFSIKDDPIQSPAEVKKDFEACGYRYLGQKNALHYYDILQFGL